MPDVIDLDQMVDKMSGLIYAFYIDFFAYFGQQIVSSINSYDAFCKKHKTTPITMYKVAIQAFLSKNGYGILPKQHTHDISANQMSIFDVVEDS